MKIYFKTYFAILLQVAQLNVITSNLNGWQYNKRQITESIKIDQLYIEGAWVVDIKLLFYVLILL